MAEFVRGQSIEYLKLRKERDENGSWWDRIPGTFYGPSRHGRHLRYAIKVEIGGRIVARYVHPTSIRATSNSGEQHGT